METETVELFPRSNGQRQVAQLMSACQRKKPTLLLG